MDTSPKYIVANKVNGSKIALYQTAVFESDFEFPSKDFVFNVNYMEEKPFGYELPLKSHKVSVEIDLGQGKFKGIFCEPVLLDDLELNLFQKTVYLYRK